MGGKSEDCRLQSFDDLHRRLKASIWLMAARSRLSRWRPIQPMVAKNATTLAACPTGVLRERRLDQTSARGGRRREGRVEGGFAFLKDFIAWKPGGPFPKEGIAIRSTILRPVAGDLFSLLPVKIGKCNRKTCHHDHVDPFGCWLPGEEQAIQPH